jgi:MFS-type transporter involved in bile tolerance (Atg22 family)
MESNSSSSKNNKKFPFGWIIFIVVIILFFSTNPTYTDFQVYLKNEFKEEAKSEGVLASAIMDIFAGPSAKLASLNTIRTDYCLFSIYDFTILGETYQYIGILDYFFEIN